jgi:hypothetical protein
MTELRDRLLDDSGAPEVLSADLRFMAARQAALAALVVDHSELYRHLYERLEREGSTDDLRRTALGAANNLGVLLQELRRRDDLVQAFNHSDEAPSVPLGAIDTLYVTTMALAGPLDEREAQLLYAPGLIEGVLYGDGPTRDWLLSFGVNPDTR